MKKFVNLFVVLIFSFNSVSFAKNQEIRKPDSINKHFDKQANTKDYDQFFDNIKTDISSDTMGFLKKKLEANPELKKHAIPKVKKTKENEYDIEVEGKKIKIEIILAEEGKIKINNQNLFFDTFDTTEKIWDKIYKSLDKKKTASHFFIKEANAFVPFPFILGYLGVIGTSIILTGIVGAHIESKRKSYCQRYAYDKRCLPYSNINDQQVPIINVNQSGN